MSCSFPGAKILLEIWTQLSMGRSLYTPGIQQAENIRKVAEGYNPASLPEARIDISLHDRFIDEAEQRVSDHRAAIEDIDRQLMPLKKSIKSGKGDGKRTLAGMKEKAKALLRTRAHNSAQIADLEAKISKAQVLKDTILQTRENSEFVNLVAHSKTMLSQTATGLAVTQVDNLMDDLGEGVKAAEDLSAAISQPLHGGRVEDAESMLDEFLAEEEEEEEEEEFDSSRGRPAAAAQANARRVSRAVLATVPVAESTMNDTLPQAPADAPILRAPVTPSRKQLPREFAAM